MPSLTLKQEAFLNAYLKTGNASEAYRQAYNAKKMSREAIKTEASRLLGHPEIAQRVAGFKSSARAEVMLSLEEHMSELKTLRELAKENGQIHAAIQAEVKRGELRKFYVKQVETGKAGDFDAMSDSDLDAFIQQEARELLAQTKRSATKH